MIVVIDTNVWVSALHFALKRGAPRQAVEGAARGDGIAICESIEDEIQRVLTARFGWTADAVIAALADVLPFPIRVEIMGSLHVCRDPNDDMVLECAVAAGAQCVVSGDKDLLVLNPYNGIRIVSPAEFLALEP
jgi:putative PIN family toxin of toxin-antitoxin system